MRTTLTLDDDVAALVHRLQKQRDASLKEVVNDALRLGLAQLEKPRARPRPVRTRVVDLGRCRLANVDNVADVIASAEGEWHG